MLNILKYFQQPSVEKYEFQDTERMQDEEAFVPPRRRPVDIRDDRDYRDEYHDSRDEFQEFSYDSGRPSTAKQHNLFAQNLQQAVHKEAEDVVKKAKVEAEKLLEEARLKADKEAQELYERVRKKAYDDGYAKGMKEGKKAGEEQAYKESRIQMRRTEEKMLDQVEGFLQECTQGRDQMFDHYQDQMRDLALNVAEKVIRISLQSSGEIVARMVQHATEKLKHREWVRVYVQKGEAQRCVQADPELAACLSMLADQVKIVPMESDDPGTCILELPNEIIDASASTQMDNIRNMLENMKN